MKIEQISIFIENKSGRLAEVTRILGESGVNIRALSLADTTDFGILRLLVDDSDGAYDKLSACGFTVNKTEVVAVKVPDHPSGLAGILAILDESKINVEYMYAFLDRDQDHAVIIFRFDNPDEALKVLQNNAVAVVDMTQVLRSRI